jgi:hypothetical protein
MSRHFCRHENINGERNDENKWRPCMQFRSLKKLPREKIWSSWTSSQKGLKTRLAGILVCIEVDLDQEWITIEVSMSSCSKTYTACITSEMTSYSRSLLIDASFLRDGVTSFETQNPQSASNSQPALFPFHLKAVPLLSRLQM